MGFIDDVRKIWGNLVNLNDPDYNERRQRIEELGTYRMYYDGSQKQTLSVKPMQADDNLTLNFCGLVIERSVALLLGSGVKFDVGEEQTQEQEYIDQVWDANSRDILLQKTAQFGGWSGIPFIKIVPGGAVSRDGKDTPLPRLVPLDPIYMQIETDPEDIDTVNRYIMRFQSTYLGKPIIRKEITERIFNDIAQGGEIVGQTISWEITNLYSGQDTHGKWEQFPPRPPEQWDYEFPPIIHWQNLPWAGHVEGKADIFDIVQIQDRANFVASNISKIIRYHAHPKTWGRGGSLGDTRSWGADELVMLSGDSAMLANLEMQSDLASSMAFLRELRQSMFDISRTVDITSMSDKIGALTNFGLRVLFMDTIAKNSSKRELYGEALTEINHRLLELAGYTNTNGGTVVFEETLPSDETEQVARDQFEIDNKLASRETVATRRGYNWEDERARIEDEASMEDNIGGALLRAFNNGQ